MQDLLLWIAEMALMDDVQECIPLLYIVLQIFHRRFETFVKDMRPYVHRMRSLMSSAECSGCRIEWCLVAEALEQAV